MEGKTFTFQVRVNTFNLTANHQTFTITCISPLPDFVDNGGNKNNEDDMPCDNTALAKVETWSWSHHSAPGAIPNGEEPKRSPAKAPSKMVQKVSNLLSFNNAWPRCYVFNFLSNMLLAFF